MMLVLEQKWMTFLQLCTTVYGKVIEVDDEDVYVSFLKHSGDMTTSTTFSQPNTVDQVWVKKYHVASYLSLAVERKGKESDYPLTKQFFVSYLIILFSG